MTLATAIEKRLESEIARALEIMGHVRDRPEGLNEADTKAAFLAARLRRLVSQETEAQEKSRA